MPSGWSVSEPEDTQIRPNPSYVLLSSPDLPDGSSSKRAGQVLGRGLLEATRAPVQIVGAVVEASAMPLREVTAQVTSRITGRDTPKPEAP